MSADAMQGAWSTPPSGIVGRAHHRPRPGWALDASAGCRRGQEGVRKLAVRVSSWCLRLFKEQVPAFFLSDFFQCFILKCFFPKCFSCVLVALPVPKWCQPEAPASQLALVPRAGMRWCCAGMHACQQRMCTCRRQVRRGCSHACARTCACLHRSRELPGRGGRPRADGDVPARERAPRNRGAVRQRQSQKHARPGQGVLLRTPPACADVRARTRTRAHTFTHLQAHTRPRIFTCTCIPRIHLSEGGCCR